MRKSTLRGITAVSLAVALAGGICACGYASRNDDGKWFQNSDFKTWHWSDNNDNNVETDIPETAALTYTVPQSIVLATSASVTSDATGCSLGAYSSSFANANHTLNVDSLCDNYGLKYRFKSYSGGDGFVFSDIYSADIELAEIRCVYDTNNVNVYRHSQSGYSIMGVYTAWDFHGNKSGLSSDQCKSSQIAVVVYNRRPYYTDAVSESFIKTASLTSLTFGGRSPDFIYSDYIVFKMTYSQYQVACDSSEYPLVYTYKQAATLPEDPVKEGYTFVGWYYDSDYTRAYNGEPLYTDTQLYAKFEINRFTVTFNSDGGSAVDNQTVDWNTSATLVTPTRGGYAFKGWFLPNGTQYTNQAIKENTTLTAKWERNRFTVTFNSDGGSSVDNQTVMLNNTVTLVIPTRTGYTFKGWYLEDGTKYENQPVTDDLTLTAQWERIMCKITFYVDGEVYETKTVEYGLSFVALVDLAKESNLKVASVYSLDGEIPPEALTTFAVTDDNVVVHSTKMTGWEKTLNILNRYKWYILGGVCVLAAIGVVSTIIAKKHKG